MSSAEAQTFTFAKIPELLPHIGRMASTLHPAMTEDFMLLLF
jgi:hypothetical protein